MTPSDGRGGAGGARSAGGSTSAERIRRLRLSGVLVVVAVLVASALLFVFPAADEPQAIRDGGPVDAVVVLGGSPAVRYQSAAALTATLPGPPPTLVLSVQYDQPVLRCGSSPSLPGVRLTCFAPDPATTSGEAVWIAEEAAARGWSRVVVATSDYHLTRSRVLVERCIRAVSPDTEVLYHAAGSEAASLRGTWRIATEWPSLLATPWDHAQVCTGRS